MKIICSEGERAFLIENIGEELTETLPWWDEDGPTCIAEELNSIQLQKGFNNQQSLNEFGAKVQKIYDSLLAKNG